jgi:hypothetical protein
MPALDNNGLVRVSISKMIQLSITVKSSNSKKHIDNQLSLIYITYRKTFKYHFVKYKRLEKRLNKRMIYAGN